MKFIEQFKYNDLNIEIMKKSTSKETTSITKIKGCIRACFRKKEEPKVYVNW